MAKVVQLQDKDGGSIYPAIAKEQILEMFYPVGSIYMSATLSTASQVQNQFGGTWVAWGSGQVPVGVDTSQTEFNAVEKTGGSKTVTLEVSQIPAHNHTFYSGRWAWSETAGGGDIINSQSETSYRFTRTTGDKGGGGAHNNLQPYITCYMYKRTA